jgi:hypothetical protein
MTRFLVSISCILSISSILLVSKSEARSARFREKAKDRAEKMKRELGHGAEIGEVRITGNGCPEGTVAAVVSPDRKALSVLFDTFIIERGPKDDIGPGRGARERVGVATCQISLPFSVPRGMKARIQTMDVRGFVSLPEGSKGLVVGAVRFLKRPRSASSNRFEFQGPLENIFNVRTIDAENSLHSFTLCGTSETVVINTHISVRNKSLAELAHLSVDSADLATEDTTLNLAVEWQQCR